MIIRYPDQILLHPATEVTTFGPGLQTLITGMQRICSLARGIGLAAPQIGASLRVAVVDAPEFNEQMVLVNPKLTPLGEETVLSEESCLSAPGVAVIITRYAKVQIDAQDAKGEQFQKVVEGALACVVQHEVDHLDGVMYFDRLGKVKKDLLLTRYRKQFKKYQRSVAHR